MANISFPWDTEPPDKWKIQFHYTRFLDPAVNYYSLAPEVQSYPEVQPDDDDSEDEPTQGGGFKYEDCPAIFGARFGYGPLRIAWDTNILIDYAKHGEQIWESDDFDPGEVGAHYRDELIALSEIMQLWLIRDIRIKMPGRQIFDARRRLPPAVLELRSWQLDHFQSALSCLELDRDIENNVPPFAPLPEGSPNDDWDRSLVEEAIATGCHVFLTGDIKLRKRNNPLAQSSRVKLLSPSELLDNLANAGELSLAKFGPYPAPDMHKWNHVMPAHESGYREH